MNIDPIRERWEIAASTHLLAHLKAKLAANPRHYGTPASFLAMRNSSAPNADASPELIARIKTLIEAKNRWTHQMRSLDQGTGVLVEIQQRTWNELITEAETADHDIPF